MVVGVGMHYLRAIKLSVPELKHLEHDEAVRRPEAGMNLRAVRQIDRLHHCIVVEKSSRHDDAFLLVNQEEVSLAHGVVGGIHAGLKLVAAAQAEIGLKRISDAR